MGKHNQYFPQSIPNPGITLEEKLEEMGMGPKEFALRTSKPEKTVTAILKGESSITPDMAIQFENVTQIPAHFWLTRQRTFDEFITREKRKSVIYEAVAWAKLFPMNDMIKKSWLPQLTSIEERVAAMLSFFVFLIVN